MTAGDTSLRLPPLMRVQPVDGYDLDAVVLVFDQTARLVDFRLQLGRELDIYSCTPARRKDVDHPGQPSERLILLHVDSAVSFVDEPTLVCDPCLANMKETLWKGNDLGGALVIDAVDGRHVVDSVKFSCTRGDYHLVVGLRDPRGRLTGKVMRNTEIPD